MTNINNSLDRFMDEFSDSQVSTRQFHQVPFRMNMKHFEKIEQLRSRLGMTRNKLLNHLVAITLNEVDIRLKAQNLKL